MTASSFDSDSDASLGLLETLETQPRWSKWGQPYWTRAVLCMAAKAGARLGGDLQAAELALSGITPEGDDLAIAFSLAARCGSIAQMQRLIDLGADATIDWPTLDAINKQQRSNSEEANRHNSDTPGLAPVIVSLPTTEALKAGRHKALLWLVEEKKAPLPGSLSLATAELLKWASPKEADATDALRALFFEAMPDESRQEWTSLTCQHLMGLWGVTQTWAPSTSTPEEQEQHRVTQLRQIETVSSWVARAVSWGAHIDSDYSNYPKHSTALGIAMGFGNVLFAQKLFDLGADPLAARHSRRGEEPVCGRVLLARALSPDMLAWGFEHGMTPTTPAQWQELRDGANAAPANDPRRHDTLAWIDARELAMNEQAQLRAVLESDGLNRPASHSPSGIATADPKHAPPARSIRL